MSPPTIRPIFIGGCERSGTTFLGSLLGAAPGAITTPESPFRFDYVRAEARHGRTASPLHWIMDHYGYKNWRTPHDKEEIVPPPTELREIVDTLVTRYARFRGVDAPQVWVDHTPTNVQLSLLEAERFPDARYIHLVRDGRAVAASIMALTWGPNAIHSAARYWLDRVAYGLALETSSLADQVIRVRYEDLLADPETTLRRLCAFCEIEFTPCMLEGGRFDLPRTTLHQHGLVGKPPEPKRATAWEDELSPREIEIFEHFAGLMLGHLGYEPRFGLGARRIRRKELIRLAAVEIVRRRVVNPRRDRKRWAALDATAPPGSEAVRPKRA